MFNLRELYDRFRMPPPPPDFELQKVVELRKRCRALISKLEGDDASTVAKKKAIFFYIFPYISIFVYVFPYYHLFLYIFSYIFILVYRLPYLFIYFDIFQ